MKIFLDDIRNPSTNDWVIVRNPEDCLKIIESMLDKIDEISFDHDLGTDLTGYDVAKLIEIMCHNGHKCPKWNVHSANPVGRDNITRAMRNAELFYKKNMSLYDIKRYIYN